jgi:hypothetical protein
MRRHVELICGILFIIFLRNSLYGADRLALRGHVVSATAHLRPIESLPGTTNLNLAIGLPLRNRSALTNLLAQLYDPKSPNFHHFLTPTEFADQFGPTKSDYEAVMAFAKAHQLKVTATHANRMLLDVSASAPEIEQALQVKLEVYQHPTEKRVFYAPNTDPSVDLNLPIVRIGGLDNFSMPRPRMKASLLNAGNKHLPTSGSGAQGTFMGKDFRSAYVPGTALTGVGESVGLLQFDGYLPSDIAYYETAAGLPNVTLTNVLIDGASGNPSGNGGEVEVSLDIEMAISMAPGLSKVILYIAPNPSPFEDVLNRMATDNAARQLSCSWYEPGGGTNVIADQIFQQMAAQGQSFFNASGDFDAYTGPIDFPGETPYITQVGGTTLTTSGPEGLWISEAVWNWGALGSGGGVSTRYAIPSWQTNISMANNGGSTSMRNTPDVALTADNIYVRANGYDYGVGGTSCAAPLWAGFAALANQQATLNGRPALGFVNPALYQIGANSSYPFSFHDITTGDTTSPISIDKFFAVPGYDLCAGWGTPIGQGLIDALSPPPDSTPPSIIAQPHSLTVATGSNAVFVVTATGSPQMSFTWFFNGTNINGATNAALLLANVQPSQAGDYSVRITNAFGFAISSNAVLTVEPPIAPVIVEQPQDVIVAPGGLAFFSVTVTGTPPTYQWTFKNSEISGATNSSLILLNVQSPDVGWYAVTVSNAAGSVTSSNASLSLATPLTSCSPLPGGAVGLWDAEGDAKNSLDASLGAINGGVQFVPGVVGQAFHFDGIDSSVHIGHDTNLNVGLTSGFTIAAWINPTEVTKNHPLVEWALPLVPVNGLNLWISLPPLHGGTGAGSLILDIPDLGTAETDHFLSTPQGLIQSNVWQHVAATYDQSSGIAALYVNGTLLTRTNFGALNAYAYGDLWFGYNPVSKGWGPAVYGEEIHYQGAMDEISVFNRALSSSEIQAMFSAGNYGTCPLPPTTITIQPTNGTVFAGNSITFTAIANGTQPLNYQWYYNSTNIPGANGPTLTLTNVALSQAGNYSVQASNAAGGITSAPAILTVLRDYPAWIPTGAPSLPWRAIACSADGLKILAASDYGQIYTSTNFGVTWTSNDVPSFSWNSVASSRNGTKLFAAGKLPSSPVGALYGSTNSGDTWQLYTNGSIGGMVCSGDGDKLIMNDVYYTYTSTDAGNSWKQSSTPAFVVACSSNGNVLVARKYSAASVSPNFGLTWKGATLGPNNIIGMAASADGQKLVATVYGGYVYTSANCGTNWQIKTSYGNWGAAALSANGAKIVTTLYQGFTGKIYTSPDFGTTWNMENAPTGEWVAFASSADGTRLIGANHATGLIYTWQLPSLQISQGDGGVTLSWPTNSAGFVLQENHNLSTTNWVDVTNGITATNWLNQIVVPVFSNDFFRLKYH